jgi:hypothetical protein
MRISSLCPEEKPVELAVVALALDDMSLRQPKCEQCSKGL